MKFGNLICSAVLGLALTGLATAADATVFKLDSLTFSGDAFGESDSDPGLVVKTNSLAPQEFSLDYVGDSEWVPLFEIWSEEEYVDWGDTSSRSFSVGLNFISPPPPFGGTVPGESAGGWLLFGFIPIGDPELSWTDHVVDLAFGPNGDGVLRLTLFDTGFEYDCHESSGTYSVSTFGTHHDDGSCRTTVKGKFELVSDATPPVDVPEPGTIALLGAGLLGLGLVRRRHAA